MFCLTDNISNTQTNARPIYDNALVDNGLPHQDVSLAHSQESVSGKLIYFCIIVCLSVCVIYELFMIIIIIIHTFIQDYKNVACNTLYLTDLY